MKERKNTHHLKKGEGNGNALFPPGKEKGKLSPKCLSRAEGKKKEGTCLAHVLEKEREKERKPSVSCPMEGNR